MRNEINVSNFIIEEQENDVTPLRINLNQDENELKLSKYKEFEGV